MHDWIGFGWTENQFTFDPGLPHDRVEKQSIPEVVQSGVLMV
jgi:hypothetical protein